MDEVYLPEGYSFKDVEFRYIYNKEGKLVLALPKEKCTSERIEKVIKQIQKAKNKAEEP